LLSLSVIASPVVARAQTDGAPVPAPPEPPSAPTPPSEPAPTPPDQPPAAPAPPVEPAPPPSAQPPATPAPTAPAGATPPASDAFPLPPSSPPSKKKHAHHAETAPAEATPEAAAASTTPPSAADKPEPKKPTDGLFIPKKASDEAPAKEDEGTDQFKIGPVVGVGLPDVLSFGGTLKLTRFLGAGINVGLIPKVQLNYYGKATLSYQHYDIYGRLYPFGGGFFLGAGAGYATVDGTMTSSYSATAAMLPVPVPGFPTTGSATYSGTGSVRTLMLTALIGYFYTTGIGFSFGVDAGLQLPIAPSQIKFSSDLKTTPPGIDALPPVKSFKNDADEQIRSTLEKIGRTPLPTINLRIGWIL